MTPFGYCVLGFMAVIALAFAIIPIGIMLGFDWNGFAQGHFNPIVGEETSTFNISDGVGSLEVERTTYTLENGETRDYFSTEKG